jgi:MarR family transcriptional regulator, 2-MHQ and catechol-resistance regulon repressor
VSRVESTKDRRIRIVALTRKGEDLIAPIFRKHAAAIRKVFAEVSSHEIQQLGQTLKQIGRRAQALGLNEEER